MLPFIIGAALIVTTVVLGVEGFRRRRSDVSWVDIALLGPFIWLNPDRYIQSKYLDRFVKLVLVWVGLFLALGIAVSVSEWR